VPLCGEDWEFWASGVGGGRSRSCDRGIPKYSREKGREDTDAPGISPMEVERLGSSDSYPLGVFSSRTFMAIMLTLSIDHEPLLF
jgi:hypothetical protein